MPRYTYSHPKTEKVIEVIQKMNDPHEYFDEKGVKWIRVFQSLQLKSDSQLDPFSAKQFMEKTDKMKKPTVGDMWDMASEASQKREAKAGKDHIKEKAIKHYNKICKGARHPYE